MESLARRLSLPFPPTVQEDPGPAVPEPAKLVTTIQNNSVEPVVPEQDNPAQADSSSIIEERVISPPLSELGGDPLLQPLLKEEEEETGMHKAKYLKCDQDKFLKSLPTENAEEQVRLACLFVLAQEWNKVKTARKRTVLSEYQAVCNSLTCPEEFPYLAKPGCVGSCTAYSFGRKLSETPDREANTVEEILLWYNQNKGKKVAKVYGPLSKRSVYSIIEQYVPELSLRLDYRDSISLKVPEGEDPKEWEQLINMIRFGGC
jgi:hypothetical protein